MHKDDFIYCADRPDQVSLKGIRDSAVENVEHSYLIYEVLKCQDKN